MNRPRCLPRKSQPCQRRTDGTSVAELAPETPALTDLEPPAQLPADTASEEPAAAAQGADEPSTQQDAISSVRLATFKARLHVMQRLTQVVDAFGDDVILTTRQVSRFRLQASVAQILTAHESAADSEPSTPSASAIDVKA